MCLIVDFKSDVNLYQILVHVTVIFRNLIYVYVCIMIKDKLIKHLYNSHLRKLPIAHGEVSVMDRYFDFCHFLKMWKSLYIYSTAKESRFFLKLE